MKGAGVLTEKADIGRLCGLCWASYFLCYLGKLSYSAAMADIIAGGVLQPTVAGTVSMTFFLCYGVGQFFSGILADRVSPQGMIAIGLAASGLCNLGMSFMRGPLGFAVVWGLNGFASAMLWAPILCILTGSLPQQTAKKFLVVLPSSMAAGTLASYLLSAGMIYLFGWSAVFVAVGGVQLAGAMLCGAGLRGMERRRLRVGRQAPDEGRAQAPGAVRSSVRAVLLSSVIAIVLLPVIINGFLKDGTTSWLPTFMMDSYALSPAMAVVVTMAIPVINLSGAFAAGFVYNRLHNELKTAAVFFGLAAAAFCTLWAAGSIPLPVTVALLGVGTASMMAANTMFLSFYPVRFARHGRVGTVGGFLDACAYLGAAVCSVATGYLKTYSGWGGVFVCWLALACLAGLCCLLFSPKLRGAGAG